MHNISISCFIVLIYVSGVPATKPREPTRLIFVYDSIPQKYAGDGTFNPTKPELALAVFFPRRQRETLLISLYLPEFSSTVNPDVHA